MKMLGYVYRGSSGTSCKGDKVSAGNVSVVSVFSDSATEGALICWSMVSAQGMGSSVRKACCIPWPKARNSNTTPAALKRGTKRMASVSRRASTGFSN